MVAGLCELKLEPRGTKCDLEHKGNPFCKLTVKETVEGE
jgi:hypothetical protein